MFEKWKNILTVGLLSAFVLGFGIWAAVKPATPSVSTSWRKMTSSMNTPIHREMLMNRGAMAEP